MYTTIGCIIFRHLYQNKIFSPLKSNRVETYQKYMFIETYSDCFDKAKKNNKMLLLRGKKVGCLKILKMHDFNKKMSALRADDTRKNVDDSRKATDNLGRGKTSKSLL